MIYPEGKQDSIMTKDKVASIQERNRQKLEEAKMKMGTQYLLHPANKISKIKKARNKARKSM